jgi:hypothetical protein
MAQNDIMFTQIVSGNRRCLELPVRLTLAVALLVAPSSHLSGQEGPFNRVLHITVTDPLNRFVTGLDRDAFQIIEGGARRALTSFSSVDDPIAVAVVSEAPLTRLDALQGPNELIQTRSVSDAVRQLVASGKPRKALIMTAAGSSEAVPGGVFIVKSDVSMLNQAVVEVCNQYLVAFMSMDPSATVEVVVKPPLGLPKLNANVWK